MPNKLTCPQCEGIWWNQVEIGQYDEQVDFSARMKPEKSKIGYVCVACGFILNEDTKNAPTLTVVLTGKSAGYKRNIMSALNLPVTEDWRNFKLYGTTLLVEKNYWDNEPPELLQLLSGAVLNIIDASSGKLPT